MIALSAATGFAGAFAGALGGSAAVAHGDTFENIWATDGNITTLNTPGAWTNLTGANPAPPASGDIAQFDSGTGLTAATTFTLGASTTWLGLSVISPGAAVTIGGTGDTSNTLTLGASGVSMGSATANMTIADPLAFSTAAPINVASGTTFTAGTTSVLNGNLTVLGAGNATFTGAMNGNNSTITLGTSGSPSSFTGNVTLTATNSAVAGAVVNAGTLSLASTSGNGTTNDALGQGTLFLNGGTVHFSGSVSGNLGYYNPIVVQSASTISSGTQLGGLITGTGQLNLSIGSGNLILLGPSTQLNGYTGLLELGTSTGLFGFTNSNGGTGVGLDLGTSSASFAYTSGNATVNLASLAGGPSTILGGDRKIGGSNNVTFSIGYGGQSTVFAGTIKDTSNSTTSTATLALTLVGGTLALTGTNTYKGATTVSAGTLSIGNGTATGTFGAGAVVNNSVIVLNRTDTAYTPANAMSGTGSLINSGTGIVTLTGNNSYSGGTTINAGVLQADNATSGMGTGMVTVNSGGAVGGTGVITAPISVLAGGIIAPGDAGVSHGAGFGVGTLTAASATLASGSILNYELTPAANDLLDITTANALSVTNAGINLYQANTTNPFETNGVYNIMQFPSPYTGVVSPSGFLNILDPVAGVTYTWGTSGDDITLTITGGTINTAWNNAGGGSWALAGNWTAGVPNAVGAVATLGSVLASPGTISLGGSETVGSLVFDNNSGAAGISYTIAQTNPTDTLVLDNGGASALASVSVTNGNHLIAAPVALNSNLLLGVSNATNTVTFSGQISGVGSVTESGSGVAVFSGNNSYSGTTTILSGTLQVGAGGSTGSLGAGNVTNGGSLIFDLSGPSTVSNVISGAGSLTQAGAGALTLTGTNTYTGKTNVNAGTLQYGSGDPSALSTGNVAFGGTGGTLDVNGNSVTLSSITGTVGVLDNVSAGGTSTVTINNGSTNTFGGTIQNTSGTVAIIKSGGGLLALTGTNTYSGGTTIAAGVVKVSGSSALGTGTVQVGTGTTGTNGLQLANGAVVSNPIVTDVGSNEFEDVPDAGAIATISGSINLLTTSAQQLRIGTTHTSSTGVPDSTLVLTGAASSSTAQAILTRGNIIFEQNGSLTTSSNIIVGRNTSAAILFVTLENNGAINSNGAQISGNNSSSDAIETTVNIQDNGVFNAGTGTMNINDSANTGSGAVSVNMSGNAEIAAGAWTILGKGVQPTFFTINSGTLKATANDPSGGQWFPALSNTDGAISANIGAGVNIDNGGFGITVGQSFGDLGGGSLNFVGTGTTTVKASNSYAGNDTVTGGTLVISDTSGSALGTGTQLTLNAGSTLASDPAVPGAIISQSVVPGSGAQTIAPGKVGSIGTLQVAGLTTNNQTTLNFDLGIGTGTVTTGDQLLLGSGTIGSGTMMTFGGTLVGGNDYRLIGGSIGGIPLANFSLPNIPGFGLSLSTSVDSGFIDLVVVQTGPLSLTWNNAGADNLWNTTSSNWNSGAGNTTYSDGSLVTFNDSNPSSTAANYNVTLNTTVSPGSVTVNNSGGNYVIGGTGSIAGTTSLSKAGSGKLTLNTVNTYTGGTTVSAGTLVAGVAGSLPSGAVSVTGGMLQLATSIGGVTLTSLAVSGSGVFDVNNNHIILNYGAGPDPIASIQAMLASGYAGGAWNGPGINSSAVASNPGYGVGYADSADAGNPAGLASGTMEIAFTLLGDANLDHAVNGVDFGILAANFNKGVTGWDKGDFNYDNTVNGVDFGALAANFNKGAAAASGGATAADFAALDAFAAANGLLADVPEPASVGLLAAGACGLLARRRRSRK